MDEVQVVQRHLALALDHRVRRGEAQQTLTVADFLERDEPAAGADQRVEGREEIAARPVQPSDHQTPDDEHGEVGEHGRQFDEAVLAHREQVELVLGAC